jgi:hypothetical protein
VSKVEAEVEIVVEVAEVGVVEEVDGKPEVNNSISSRVQDVLTLTVL